MGIVNRTLLKRLMRFAHMPRAAWRKVLMHDPCVFCVGKPKTLDHIHPQNFGGPDGWENLAPACISCNLMKADGSLMWMLWRLQEKRAGRMRARVIGHRNGAPIKSLLEYQGMLRKPSRQEFA